MFTDAQIIELSASKLAELIKDKQLTSVQVVKAFLNRIDEVNPKLNAIVERNEKALEDAQELDKYYEETGKVKGPLHGVPITIKEQYAVKGFKQTQGGVYYLRDHRAKEDCTVVARVRAAGVVILGTTNTPELVLSYETTNNLYGRTCNAVDQTRSAGGSSGGEGAIIAAKGSPFGLGTDIGGSIRIPCHYNGIMGIKPSKGRVPVTDCYYINDHIGFESMVVSADMGSLGPMSRFVEDLELGLSIISGIDHKDSGTVLGPYEYGLSSKIDVPNLRICYYDEHESAPVTQCTKDSINNVIDLLKKNGVTNIKRDIPDVISRAHNLWPRVIGRLGTAGFVAESTKDGGVTTQQFKWMLEYLEGKDVKSPMEYELLLMEWKRYNNDALQFMSNYDVVISPVTSTPAPLHDRANDFVSLTYTLVWSLSCYPSLVVGNVGTGRGDFEALPIGIQITVSPFREDIGFAFAKFLQEKLNQSRPDGKSI